MTKHIHKRFTDEQIKASLRKGRILPLLNDKKRRKGILRE